METKAPKIHVCQSFSMHNHSSEENVAMISKGKWKMMENNIVAINNNRGKG